jgi:hypothetical protein
MEHIHSCVDTYINKSVNALNCAHTYYLLAIKLVSQFSNDERRLASESHLHPGLIYSDRPSAEPTLMSPFIATFNSTTYVNCEHT